MWPFKKTQQDAIELLARKLQAHIDKTEGLEAGATGPRLGAEAKVADDKDVARMIKEYPIGRRFEYLGRTMCVEIRFTDDNGVRFIGCDYVDNSGSIKEYFFGEWQFESLLSIGENHVAI